MSFKKSFQDGQRAGAHSKDVKGPPSLRLVLGIVEPRYTFHYFPLKMDICTFYSLFVQIGSSPNLSGERHDAEKTVVARMC